MSTELSSTKVRSTKSPVSILGVPFDQVTTQDAIELIERMIASGQTHQLATANVDFIVQAQHDSELRRILFDADLVFGDGTPVVWASRWLGNPLPERVAGSDLVPRLIEIAAQKGYRVFLLGATPNVAAKAIGKMRGRFPNLLIDSYSPPFKPLAQMDHEEILRRIQAAKPDLLFVGFGCPKQEKWIAMHRERLGVPVAIGVGGTIDFLAGHLKRAPRWMQRSGTEWIFRLAQEPRRLFKRYAMDLRVFGWRLLQQLWKFQWHRSKGFAATANIPSHIRNGFFQLPKVFDGRAVRQLALSHSKLTESSRVLRVDAGNVRFIDSTGIGFLSWLEKELSAQGGHVVFTSASKELRRAFRFMKLETFFSFAPEETVLSELVLSQQV